MKKKKEQLILQNHDSFTFTQESRTKAKSADSQPNKCRNGPMLHCRRKCLLSECLQLDVIYRVQTYSAKININRNSLLTVNYIGFFLQPLQGLKLTWIPACPLGKQLSAFASLGTFLGCLSNDLVRGWLASPLGQWIVKVTCSQTKSTRPGWPDGTFLTEE